MRNIELQQQFLRAKPLKITHYNLERHPLLAIKNEPRTLPIRQQITHLNLHMNQSSYVKHIVPTNISRAFDQAILRLENTAQERLVQQVTERVADTRQNFFSNKYSKYSYRALKLGLKRSTSVPHFCLIGQHIYHCWACLPV